LIKNEDAMGKAVMAVFNKGTNANPLLFDQIANGSRFRLSKWSRNFYDALKDEK